jgi:two-component system, response regulator RegA
MPSVLVVDDDADTRRNMADIFGDLGYAVDAAESAEVALDMAGRQSFDLGLLDLRMPGMDGLTLCRHLTRLYPRMVAMIFTAYGAGHLAEEARKRGCPTPSSQTDRFYATIGAGRRGASASELTGLAQGHRILPAPPSHSPYETTQFTGQ